MTTEVILRKPTPEEIDQAKLPAQYEAARAAIVACKSIDECKEWADKSAALAGYYRLARDETAVQEMRALQSWALRRAGELLQQIPSAQGANLTSAGRAGAVPISRTQAAADAGMSDRQRKTALRLASIPEQDFEADVGSTTVSELAMRGTVARPTPAAAPAAPSTPAVTDPPRTPDPVAEVSFFGVKEPGFFGI
jgi:hypothetical protein